MNCPQCGREAPSDAAFCAGCGTDLRGACTSCGRQLAADAKFCAGCGQAVALPASATEPAAPLLRGERRAATVLFSDLTGYTALNEHLDPEDVAQILDEIKGAARQIVEQHGGTVNQFVGDEVMALFGIPVAHDDDARRAVAAALELHAFVRELDERVERHPEPLRMHSGIQTGLVVAQQRDRREGVFAATGDTVNTAAHLLTSSEPDQILVGASTRSRVTSFFETEPVGELTLKNKAEPVPAFAITRAREVASRFEVEGAGLAPLTGRDVEWARLSAALDAARSEARFVHLVGEAGIGKSRLAHEFGTQAEGHGARLLRGSCEATGRGVPYLPFVGALRRLLEIQSQQHPEEVVARLERTTEELGCGEHLPIYLHLLSIGSEAHPADPSKLGEELPRAIRDALAALLQQLARRAPLLLHLEDWHWADEASRGLLPLLARELRDDPVLLLLDHRPDAEPEWSELTAERIALQPLNAAGTRDLVASCLEASEIQPSLVDLIHERTAGNPLFVNELCAVLLESDVLVRSGDEITTADRVESIEVPDTVQAVLQSRIDRLEPASRDLMRIASVVGRDVPGAVLEGLNPGLSELDLHLRELERQDFLEPYVEESETTWSFRHVTIQEVAYETMLRRERAEIHLRVGEVLEELHGEERLGEHVESLARHFRLGGEEEKAVDYLEQAAWKAAGSYAFAQAREHFHRAIQILAGRKEEDDEAARRRIDLTMRWAEVNLFGPSIHQVEQLESARGRAMALGDPERIVTLTYWICWVYYAVGEQTKAIELLEQVVELVRPAGDDVILGMMMLALGHSYAVARDPRALESLEGGLALRRPAHEEEDAGVDDVHVMDSAGALDSFSQCQVALLQAYAGDWERARPGFGAAIDRVRKTGSLSTESSNWITFGLACIVAGDWETAIECARQARQIAEHVRAHYHLDTADGIEGYARWRQAGADGNEERERGLRLLRRATERLEKSGALLSMSLTSACYADVLAERGEHDEAERRARAALERGEHDDRMGEDLALRVLVRLAGDGEEASALRDELTRLAASRESARDQALAALAIADASSDAAGQASARASLRDLGIGAGIR